MKSITRLYLLVLFVLLGQQIFALHSDEIYDSLILEERGFDQEEISDYKESGEFNYGYETRKNNTLLQALLFWLATLFEDLFYLGTDTPIGKFIIIAIIAAVAIYALLKILNIRTNIFLSDRVLNRSPGNVHEENIHELNLIELVKKALKKEDFREAIRLTYLLALKSLSDNNIINWLPGKTNSEYLNEIKSDELKAGFRNLNYYFVYTWYGNFKVNNSHYAKVKSIFENWEIDLSK